MISTLPHANASPDWVLEQNPSEQLTYSPLSSDPETDILTGLTGRRSSTTTSEELTPDNFFNSGYFTVGESGEISIEFVFDGGWFRPTVAIYSLENFPADPLTNYPAYIKEVANRVLSNSTEGHAVISDAEESAYIKGRNNFGEYQGVKTFNMNPGENFGVVVVPNGGIEDLFNYPNLPGNQRPLFSLATDNPDDKFWPGQIASVREDSGLLAIEDLSVNGNRSDRDYNDIILNLTGATATVPSLDELINPAKKWPEKNLGNKLNEYINFSELTWDEGVFKASESGELNISYLFDGGGYEGDFSLINLEGLNAKSHPDFVKQAAERALSNSELGYRVIQDKEEGALFDKRLGEKSRNSGEYLGEKTFLVNPGDEYGFMLVPNGTVEEVSEKPNIGWSKRPVFSMSTSSEIDTFLPGQFVDLTGDGQVFVFEDVRPDRRNFDGDYNDFVFSVSGLEGSAASVEEYINPDKDWRSSDNGIEFLEIVNELVNKDSSPPTITVELANDTGEDDTDKITSDPTLTGQVIDEGEVVSFEISRTGVSPVTGESDNFVEVAAELESDGSFVLDRSALEEILGDTLPEGMNAVYLRATDEEGNESEVVSFEFTLEEEDLLGPEIEAMAGISGLDAYPDAITLPPTGTRELSVKINGWLESPELTEDRGDISYLVENSEVLEVSPEGVITALAGGSTNITVQYGDAEITIPVLVAAPETGPALVDESGGIVEGSDGSLVMLAPGALTSESLVNLTPLQQEDLSLPVPESFKFAAAFDLEIEDDKLDLPAQLAVPAPADLEVGTEVWFMRSGALPDETGTWNPIWLQEESGIVDADGFIRTQSPPYPGVLRPGEYMVVFEGQPGSMTIAKGKVTQTTNVPLAFFGIIDPRGDIGQLIDPDSFVTAFSVSYDISSVDVIAIPQVGLPVKTEVGVQRANGVASFEAVLDLPAPEGDPTADPVLQGVELKFSDENGEPFAQNNNEPVLFLTADNALIDSADLATSKGSRFEDLTPQFYVGNEVIEGTVLLDLSEEIDENRVTVAVTVPNTVPLGSSRISLARQQDLLSEQSRTEPVYVEVEFESNKVRLENEKEYVFTTLASADSLSVVDATNPEAVVNSTSSEDLLLGKIPVGVDGAVDRPESLAITGDNSRIYVPLKFSGGVAAVDPMMLSQIDNEPDTPDVAEPIPLPDGARPQDIALGLRDEFAYIADERNPYVYVLDIDPFSDSYHEVLQTIVLDTDRGDEDLNRLAISSDGRRLFVTSKDGYIYAANIDPLDKPLESEINSRKWHEQIGRFKTEQGGMGVGATNEAEMMTFTSGNRDFDFYGFGVLEVTNDDTLNFEAEIRYTELGLGLATDYFDVNEGYAVVLTDDASYGFVAGLNWNGNINDSEEVIDGGNIGIVENPLGENPRFVAATRPIPGRLTRDLVLSNDDKYLYVSNPNLSAGGDVFVFDVEEMTKTLEEPEEYVIDGLDRGVGSPFFDESTSREVTAADFASVPIDDINPEISIAADYQILLEDRPRNQFTFGVPEGSTRSPINIGGNPREIAITGGDRLDLEEIDLIDSDTGEPDLTPTFEWDFDGIPPENIEEVNLFVSVLDEGNGLLPWDEVVDLSGPNGNEFLHGKGLNRPQQLDLLSKPWELSAYGSENDFNPNRILTATWREDDSGAGRWTLNDGGTSREGDNTSFSLFQNRTLTVGQKYHVAVEAWTTNGENYIDFAEFSTPLPPALNGEDTFRSVTLVTHGFQAPVISPPGIPNSFIAMAHGIADGGDDDPGLVMRYDGHTGYWVPIDESGSRLIDTRPSEENYLTALAEYINPQNPTPGQTNYLQEQTPIVLVQDWSSDSSIPDSGFSEAAADAFFASLVQLDGLLGGDVGSEDGLYDESGNLIRTQGAILNSPLHFIGFSRGTVVNSEMVQRLMTYFPEAGGKEGTGQRDLQMTTLDPHDFDQPSISLPGLGAFSDFREPKVQVWEGVTFADNYYQTVPRVEFGIPPIPTATPAGRDIPNLLGPDAGRTDLRAGLNFPRNSDEELLGDPDLAVLLGTRRNTEGHENSRIGFTEDNFVGAPHQRVVTWYGGTADLFPTDFPPGDRESRPIYRRRGDAVEQELFDKSFYARDRNPPFNPWYVPDHTKANFSRGIDSAPTEGIGTGWFYSVLGGGLSPGDDGTSLRPRSDVGRVPVSFENTYDSNMRGDFAVPTLFNGNFDAVYNPSGFLRNSISREIPGWSYHNSANSTLRRPTDNLVDWRDIPALNVPRPFRRMDNTQENQTYLERLNIEQPNYALRLESEESITHNRFVVPDWGALRFNLHVPALTDGEVRVSIRGDAPGFQDYRELGTVNLEQAGGHRRDYADDLHRIGFATQGFETFQMDIPGVLRGKAATLKFEVNNGTVYLDDVFFKSAHLKFGNPSEARYYPGLSDENTTNEDRNFLLEKPQFATSYDNLNKTPKWVSWQLNQTWLGTTGRGSQKFTEDPMIPASWGRIKEGDYKYSDYVQGHMLPSHDRTNTFKDNAATFLMTNVVPQHFDNNNIFMGETPDRGAWANFENYLHNLVTSDTANEVYAIAGGYDSNPNPQRYSHYARTTTLTNPQILIDKGITIPEWTWKVALILERPGQGVADVTANTPAYAILTPNRVEPNHTPTRPDGTVGNNADFASPEPHPFNDLVGSNRPNLNNKAEWRDWQNWVLTIDELETLTNLDFFSHIPEDIQEQLESTISGVI